MTIKKPRNRRRSPIDCELADEIFSDIYYELDAAGRAAGIQASTLNVAGRVWRKINQYLNFPKGSPERDEAENFLADKEIIYERRAHNSRVFKLPKD